MAVHFLLRFILQPQHTTGSRIYPAFCGAILIENRRKFLNFALFPSQHRNNPRKHRHFRYLQHQRSFFVHFTAPFQKIAEPRQLSALPSDVFREMGLYSTIAYSCTQIGKRFEPSKFVLACLFVEPFERFCFRFLLSNMSAVVTVWIFYGNKKDVYLPYA